MDLKFVQTFILKEGNYKNGQTKGNGPTTLVTNPP